MRGGPWRTGRLLQALCLAALASPACDRGPASDPLPAATAPEADPWFADATAEFGLDFTQQAEDRPGHWMPEIMAAGAALFDYDGDGDLDVYLTNGSGVEGGDTGSVLGNRLFRQEPPGHFADVTQEAGVGDPGYGMGVAVGDVNNDGHPDLYVTNYGPNRLYLNRGDGSFLDVTARWKAAVGGWSTSATFCDVDRDGFLDLFVTRYVVVDETRRCSDPAGRPEYCTPRAFPPARDVLLHNEGGRAFRDVSTAAGLGQAFGPGLGVTCEDFDDDGLPDVYVANDLGENQLWVNQGDGTFRDEALVRGAAYNLEGRVESGMGVVAADLDNDLDLDLFVTHLRAQTNTLYRNLGADRGFEDTTAACGLAQSSLAFTGFGTAALDVDLDGDLDLTVANGRVLRDTVLPGAPAAVRWAAYAEPNLFYLNEGECRFVAAPAAGAAFTTPVEITRALALGDVDDDGGVDLLVGNLHGPARLYRNRAPRQGAWLRIRAMDPRLKRDAIGARLVIEQDGRRQLRTISRGFSYLSSSDPRAHVGLYRDGGPVRLGVRWPDGLAEGFDVPELDRTITVRRGEGHR